MVLYWHNDKMCFFSNWIIFFFIIKGRLLLSYWSNWEIMITWRQMQPVTDLILVIFRHCADNLKNRKKIQHQCYISLIGEFKFLFYFNKINIKGFLKVSTKRCYQHFFLILFKRDIITFLITIHRKKRGVFTIFLTISVVVRKNSYWEV